ncbi:MAG: hypothetical protein RMJ44_11485 [Cytophagales bacterium]|nr:hypothetical protein [Bernardetiaceae bacterium]MDW8211698.1 hypothetical protein [Cytophagales bacterium]
MWQLIIALVRLRAMAFKRSLSQLGSKRLAILLALCAWIVLRLIAFQSLQIWLSTAAVIILALHWVRNDIFFLRTLTPAWRWLVRVEYVLLAIPPVALMLAAKYLQGVAALLMFIFLLPCLQFFFPGGGNYFNKLLTKFFPANMYEWKAGLRRNQWLLSGMYILAILLHSVLEGQLILSLLCTIVVGSFYLDCEPRLWLELQDAFAAKKFLWRKIKEGCKGSVLTQLPFVVCIATVHFRQIWLVAFLLLMAGACIAYAICLKYALYEQERSLEPFLLHHLIFVMSLATGAFFPVAVYLAWRAYRNACQHLTDLFNHA